MVETDSAGLPGARGRCEGGGGNESLSAALGLAKPSCPLVLTAPQALPSAALPAPYQPCTSALPAAYQHLRSLPALPPLPGNRGKGEGVFQLHSALVSDRILSCPRPRSPTPRPLYQRPSSYQLHTSNLAALPLAPPPSCPPNLHPPLAVAARPASDPPPMAHPCAAAPPQVAGETFDVELVPRILSVSPREGSMAGGTDVTVKGWSCGSEATRAIQGRVLASGEA